MFVVKDIWSGLEEVPSTFLASASPHQDEMMGDGRCLEIIDLKATNLFDNRLDRQHGRA